MLKHRPRTLRAFLLLGAIVNVAVAWGAMYSPSTKLCGAFRSTRKSIPLLHVVANGLGRTEVATLREYKPMGDILTDPRLPVADYLPAWAMASTPDEDKHWIRDFASGLPFRSLALRSHDCWHDDFGWQCTDVDDAITFATLPFDLMPPAKRPACIPLRPLWPGFALNTLFYAGILWGGWLLVAAPFALRRRRRIKRGLCRQCGYDLRGRAADANFCPECGANA